jgi:hypothetical protein
MQLPCLHHTTQQLGSQQEEQICVGHHIQFEGRFSSLDHRLLLLGTVGCRMADLIK